MFRGRLRKRSKGTKRERGGRETNRQAIDQAHAPGCGIVEISTIAI